MSLTNNQITALNFKDFYTAIRPYLCNSAHGGFTPIGTVISVMGKQAPHNYLVCDGTVYNIVDYPELAAYFAGQFEASNFFGGDGVTTFAVPDLRGEFLRGAGTNGHTSSGDGASVGEHQSATGINPGWVNNQSGGFSLPVAPSSNYSSLIVDSGDKYVNTGKRKSIASSTYLREVADTTSDGGYWTIRPTNTSVLYCVATKNIFMDAGHNYSTDEQVVGTWIDGKPLYQKTIIGTTPDGTETTKYVPIGTQIASGFSMSSIVHDGDGHWFTAFNRNVQDASQIFRINVFSNSAVENPNCLRVDCSVTNWQNKTFYATIQYTKTTD